VAKLTEDLILQAVRKNLLPGLAKQIGEKNPNKRGSFGCDAFLITEEEAKARKQFAEYQACYVEDVLSRLDPDQLAELQKKLAGVENWTEQLTRLTKHELKIWSAIKANLTVKGEEYCQTLANAHTRPRLKWINGGCPATYPQAYQNQHWKRQIHEERSRLNKKIRKMIAHFTG
jgi:hypothetical protein